MALRHFALVIAALLLPSVTFAQAPSSPAHDTAHAPATKKHATSTKSHDTAHKTVPAKAADKKKHPAPPKAAEPPKHEAKIQPKPAKPAPPPPDPNKGTVTGLALPRFAALRADEVNLRAGPGDRYPIEWLYKRRGMPVEIEREFEVWRLVTVPDGTKGWVHSATLMGRRDFIIRDKERTLRAGPADTARAVAVLKPGVVGRIRSCAADAPWCKVQVGGYRGWLPRDAFWGALPNEAIAD